MVRTEFERRYISARRKAISRDFAHLNDIQREAVMATQGPLLILAGAGSGKTTVLINRIANLLRYGCGSDSDYVPHDATEEDLLLLETYADTGGWGPCMPHGAQGIPPRMLELCAIDPIPPWRVIAITFTNKAAGEMKGRLERMLGAGAEDIWASTFHSACTRILRRNIDRLGYGQSFTIYDTSDTASLMKRILKALDVEERTLPHKTVLGYISRAKDAMISAEDFLASAEKIGDMRRKIIGRAFVEYETRMKASNTLDFDDLILLTVRLFQEYPDVLQHYQSRFMYVLVDEYQDTNNLQYKLAACLAGEHNNICVVGDDDQSIYKFRGATIENILNFEKQFNDARVIRLEQNYRSTGYILSAANDVIRNNKSRKGKKLWTENDSGDKPQLTITSDERTEAQLVADTIKASVAEGRVWSEHAVLYRMNAQSNQLETAFKRSGIPFRIFGGMGFYERAEIKDMLAYLCVIHNPNDDVRLLRIINNPPRGIGNTTIGKIAALAAEANTTVFEVAKESHKHDELKSSAARLLLFTDMVDDLRELSSNAPLDMLYDALISKTGYVRMLEEKGTDENIARIENVRELKTNIISFMNENGGTLFDFLSETSLFTDLDRDDQNTDRVLMMTMHSAKGLEFDTVFIVGAEEGIFPSNRTIGEPEEIEEERRLCYVAMTRAMRKLYFISVQRRMLFGKTTPAHTSRFINEIGFDNIEITEQYKNQDYNYGQFSSNYGQFSNNYGQFNSNYGQFSSNYGQFSSNNKQFSNNNGNQRTSTPNMPQKTQLSSLNSPPSTEGPNSPLSIKTPTPEFKKGDAICHKTFGFGIITGISQAGGDALLEIAFDNGGTKRMLLNSVQRYIKKV